MIKAVQGLAFEAAIHRFQGHFRLRRVRRAFDVNREQKLFFSRVNDKGLLSKALIFNDFLWLPDLGSNQGPTD